MAAPKTEMALVQRNRVRVVLDNDSRQPGCLPQELAKVDVRPRLPVVEKLVREPDYAASAVDMTRQRDALPEGLDGTVPVVFATA